MQYSGKFTLIAWKQLRAKIDDLINIRRGYETSSAYNPHNWSKPKIKWWLPLRRMNEREYVELSKKFQ